VGKRLVCNQVFESSILSVSTISCPVCNVIERRAASLPIYPYRCSRCRRCFQCGHGLIGYDYWVCFDGFKKPTEFDPGVVAMVLKELPDVAEAVLAPR
jgi:hypothetical protein